MTSTKDTLLTCLLTPMSWVYGACTYVRNKLFDRGIFLKEKVYDVPIVCVGNLTVGGTGKTPHVEYLVAHLAGEYNIGVLSRGYKRKTRGFVLANAKSTPDSIGDEPYQIYQKFGMRIRVAACESRRKGIEQMLAADPKLNLIILDDAFQHRYVKPTVAVLLMDYTRPFYSDKLLPLGRLRESPRGCDRADIVVVSKCPDNLQPLDYRLTKKHLDLMAYQKLFFSRYNYGGLLPVFPDDSPYQANLALLTARDSILLLTGIAHPRPFVLHFKNYEAKVRVSHYPDHHDFSRKDLEVIRQKFEDMSGARKIIVTTEKDATRLSNNPYFPESLKPFIFYLPIAVELVPAMEDAPDLGAAVRTALRNASAMKDTPWAAEG